jgi:hypothetical protein
VGHLEIGSMELKEKKVGSLKERLLQSRDSDEGQIKAEKPDRVESESRLKKVLGEQIDASKPIKNKIMNPVPSKFRSIGNNELFDRWMEALDDFPVFVEFDPLSANDLEGLVDTQSEQAPSVQEEQKSKFAHALKSKRTSKKDVETIQTPTLLKDKKIPKKPSVKKKEEWLQIESRENREDKIKKPADVRRLSTVQQKKSLPVPKKLKEGGKGQSTFVSSIKKISSLADEIILKIDQEEQKKLEPEKVVPKKSGHKAQEKPFRPPFQESGEKPFQKEDSKGMSAFKKGSPGIREITENPVYKKKNPSTRSPESVVDKLRLLVETIMTPPKKAVGASGKSPSSNRTVDTRQGGFDTIPDQGGRPAGDVFQITQPIQSTVIPEVKSEVQKVATENATSRSNLMSAEEMADKINEVLKEQAWIKGTNLP